MLGGVTIGHSKENNKQGSGRYARRKRWQRVAGGVATGSDEGAESSQKSGGRESLAQSNRGGSKQGFLGGKGGLGS